MAAKLNLDPDTEQMINEVIATGYFANRDDVLRQGVRLVCEQMDFPQRNGPEEALSADSPMWRRAASVRSKTRFLR